LSESYGDLAGVLKDGILVRDEVFFVSNANWAMGLLATWLMLCVVLSGYYLLLLVRPERLGLYERLESLAGGTAVGPTLDKELLHGWQSLAVHKTSTMKTVISKSFLCTTAPFDTFVFPLAELVWVYHEQV